MTLPFCRLSFKLTGQRIIILLIKKSNGALPEKAHGARSGKRSAPRRVKCALVPHPKKSVIFSEQVRGNRSLQKMPKAFSEGEGLTRTVLLRYHSTLKLRMTRSYEGRSLRLAARFRLAQPSEARRAKDGAARETRTLTGLLPHAPEACVSTNFTIAACCEIRLSPCSCCTDISCEVKRNWA